VSSTEDQRFSAIVTRFLERRCEMDAEFSISDERFFQRFRAYWMHSPEHFDHPALLGQLRVELRLRGFCAQPGGKHPRWHGLTLRWRASEGRPGPPAKQTRDARRRPGIGPDLPA
jgi:hypothetical protein